MGKWTGGITWGASVTLAALLMSPGGWSQNTGSAANGAQDPASSTAAATRQIQMIPAKAELEKGLNAKKLKPGDSVTAKLEQTVNLPNEPALKRNTVLVGKVDAVEASQHHSNSKVTVTFNQAKLKDGTVLPVKVTVMRVSEPATAQADAATGGPQAEGAAMPQGAPAAGGPGANPGGAPGMQGAAPAQPAPQPMNTEPPTQGAASASEQNGVPGVMPRSDIHQTTSATFLSNGRNVEVPGGTQMQLAIAYIPKGVQVH